MHRLRVDLYTVGIQVVAGSLPLQLQKTHWNIKIDLYFEDAVHTDPVLSRNLEFWCSHLKPDGIVCGHDYTDRFPDVRVGADRLAARYQRRLQVVGTLWLLLPTHAEAASDHVRKTIARLTELEGTLKPVVGPAAEQRAAALTRANEIHSFAYEMVIDDTPSGAAVRLGDEFVVRGTVRNTSAYDWPTILGPDLYLEIGAELHIANEKVSMARQAVPGHTIGAGQDFRFELRLPAAGVGAGVCTVDLLYRHLFWFRNRGAKSKKVAVDLLPAPAGRPRAMSGTIDTERASMPLPPGRWFHSYDFGDGEVAKGGKPLSQLRREADVFFSEPVASMTVLDVGAWDGYFSFEAERRGAASVLATDHFCWSGPGWGSKAGFDYAHAKFKSRVRSHDVDVFALDPEKFGVFDVVLFLGVLYHLKNPFGGLEQVSRMIRTYAVIETAVDELDHPTAVMRYYLDDELNGDRTNFFAPNHQCLEYMLRDVGFKRFKFSTIEYASPVKRVVVHAWK